MAQWAVAALVLAATLSMVWAVAVDRAPSGDATSDEPPSSYGEDARLDRLWDGCEAGRVEDCDALYWGSPVGSGYERFSAGR